MIIALSRTQLRDDAPLSEYAETAQKMKETVSSMPGYVSHKTLFAEDGERVTIYKFESEEDLDSWHKHAEHVETQKRGREAFYQSYYILHSKVVEQYKWLREDASEPDPAPWWFTSSGETDGT